MSEEKRPVGLTLFAGVQFLFAAALLMAFVTRFTVPEVRDAVPLTVYSIASPAATFLLLLLSGIGFLKMRKVLGYVVGNVFALGSILNVAVGAYVMRGTIPITMQIPSLIYPLLLAMFLNLRYKKYLVK